MTPIKRVPKPRCTGLDQILTAKRTSNASGAHAPAKSKQKAKRTLQKLIKGGYYD